MKCEDSWGRCVQAVRPSLFDVACQPELLIALTFANIMSPALWELRQKIYERLRDNPTAPDCSQGEAVMRAIHDYVNRKFYSPTPAEVLQSWGTLDLNEERTRLGVDNVDYAVNVIVSGFKKILALGGKTGIEDLLQLIAAGRFPDYHYAILEIIEAQHCNERAQKHRPLGVVSCADEAAMIAALAFTEPAVGPDDVILLGSPFHYTTFINYQGECFWFNGKKEFHTAQSWAEQARGYPDIQHAFDVRVEPFDRIIAPSGCHFFATNKSTIPASSLKRIGDCLRCFFGTELQQIRTAHERGIVFQDNSQLFAPLANLAQVPGAQEAEQSIRATAEQHPGSEYELALYAFRGLQVRCPEVYLYAALRPRRVRELAAGVQTIADAIQLTKRVLNDESILHHHDRLALPDEVLLFGAGHHRDKALLLYALIQHAPQVPPAFKHEARLVFTKTTSYVRINGQTINTMTFIFEVNKDEVLTEINLSDGMPCGN